MAGKIWKSYQDYLDSNQWKSIKKHHNESFGFYDYCEVTGKNENIHYHHWRYEKNWEDDSSENIIRISSEVHKFIHNNEGLININDSREAYLTELRRHYLEHIKTYGFFDGYETSESHKKQEIEDLKYTLEKIRYTLNLTLEKLVKKP